MTTSLFDRLGGEENIKKISNDLVELHLINPLFKNISDNEYMAAVDDVMSALSQNGIGDAEKAEVLYIFYSLRPEVVGV